MAHKPVLLLSLRQMDRLIVGRLIFADLHAPLKVGSDPVFDGPGFEMTFHGAFRLFIPAQSMTETAVFAYVLCPNPSEAMFTFEDARSRIIQSFPRDDYFVDEIEDLIVVMKVTP